MASWEGSKTKRGTRRAALRIQSPVNRMASYSNPESKKEEFRKYLERAGVIDALTKVLVALYETAEKPANALDFIKQYLNASNAGEVETLKTELEKVRVEKDALQAELAAVQVPTPPRRASDSGKRGP